MISSSSLSFKVYEKKQALSMKVLEEVKNKRISMNVGGGGIVSWNILINHIKVHKICKAFYLKLL
jgi:hypothetical protein